MRAVFDVGQYVSATIQARGHPAQLLTAWRAGEFELVTSTSILDDLRRVLFYPHIRKRHQWSDEEIHLFVESIALAATLTPGHLEVTAVLKMTLQTTRFLRVRRRVKLTILLPAMSTSLSLGALPGSRSYLHGAFLRF